MLAERLTTGAARIADALLLAFPALAAEEPQRRLVSVGSDTLEPIFRAWGDELELRIPGIVFELHATGSTTAPPALSIGRSQLAPMSRPMTDGEAAAFEEARGHPPISVRVALDALAVYVHRDNPLRGLSIPQLDGIFSSTYACGGREVSRWGDVVLGALTRKPLH